MVNISMNDRSNKMPFLIGVAGSTASGKSTVSQKIMDFVMVEKDHATEHHINRISQESFYRELTEKESELASKGLFDFDHPSSIDEALLFSCLTDIKKSKPTRIPIYDFKQNSRIKDKYFTLEPSNGVIFEGILAFYYKEIRELFDLKLFIDVDSDTRLARRVLRDTEELGRNLDNVLRQYTTLVKPAFEEFCVPTKKYADVTIPRGAENNVAISLVAQHIMDFIKIQPEDCSCKKLS